MKSLWKLIHDFKKLDKDQKKALPIFYRSRVIVKKPFNIQSQANAEEKHKVGELGKDDEIVFERPEEIVDENATFKKLPIGNKWKRIKGFYRNHVFNIRSGYIYVNPDYLKAKKIHSPRLGGVQSCNVPVRNGEVLGWASNDGTAKEKKTVHMELFVKEKSDLTALKKYTDAQIKKNASLKNENLLVLDKTLIQSDINAAYNAKKSIDVTTLIKKTDSKGCKYKELCVEKAIKGDDTASKMRVMVVKHPPEWLQEEKDQELKDRFETILGWKPEKCDAYKELYIDKFAFWHQLTGFPDEFYYFHPIKCIEHFKKLSESTIEIEILKENGRHAKVETEFSIYNNDGKLIKRGRFKKGYAKLSSGDINLVDKYYVWLENRAGSETTLFEGKPYRKFIISSNTSELINVSHIYLDMDIPDWEKRFKDDRKLKVNGIHGPAGEKCIQRKSYSRYAKDIMYFASLDELKVNKKNTFTTKDDFDVWSIDATEISVTSNAVVIPDGDHGPYVMAVSMTSKVLFYCKKINKAYSVQYHMQVTEVIGGVDLNVISASISQCYGSKKFKKGTSPLDVVLSYEGEFRVNSWNIGPVNFGEFYGDNTDGWPWEGIFVGGALGLSAPAGSLQLIIDYKIPKDKKAKLKTAEDLDDVSNSSTAQYHFNHYTKY